MPSTNLRLVAPIAGFLAISPLWGGCDAYDGDEESPTDQDLDEVAQEAGERAEYGHMIRSPEPVLEEVEALANHYVEAVRSGDIEALPLLLSEAGRERLDRDENEALDEGELRAYLDSEARKIALSLDPDAPLHVTRLDIAADGLSADVWFSQGGEELPKPLGFIREDEAWLYAGPAALQTRAKKYFKVQNQSTSTRYVGCFGGGVSVAPKATTYAYCYDQKCGWGNGGGRFDYNGWHSCDYNTWGVDFYVNSSGFGYCADDC